MEDLDFLKDRIIAHRGYHDISIGIPENSMSAFKKAINNNFPIELDIHVLKDNTVVVFHDDNLKRMAGLDKKISDCFYSEIENLNLLGTNEKIPTLKQVLDLVNSSVPLLIEFKSDGTIKRLEEETMKLLLNYAGEYAIQSFHPGCINYFRKHYPNIPRGQLAHSYRNSKIPCIVKLGLRNMIFNYITKPDFISYDIKSCNKIKINKWKKKRLVLGWTIKNQEDYEKNKTIFNNLICENMQKYIK